MTIFCCLKECITNKTGKLDENPEFDKVWNNFILVRYLSMDDRFIEFATMANKYVGTLSKRQFYKLCLKGVPYYKNSFIQYIKKADKKVKTVDTEE